MGTLQSCTPGRGVASPCVIPIPAVCCLQDWLPASCRWPLKEDWLPRRLPSPQGFTAPSWQGCDASWVGLCAGLRLGLQMRIEIRYHIYWCDCLTGVVFIENPSFLGAILILQVENVKAFSPDGRITGGQGEDLWWDSKWLTHECCTFKLKNFQRNQWKKPHI